MQHSDKPPQGRCENGCNPKSLVTHTLTPVRFGGNRGTKPGRASLTLAQEFVMEYLCLAAAIFMVIIFLFGLFWFLCVLSAQIDDEQGTR